MRAGWIQTRPVHGDVKANLRQVADLVATRHADLWVLPELFSTGYLFDNRAHLASLAEPIPDGLVVQELVTLASRTGCSFVAGIAERAQDGRLFNSAVALDSTGVRGLYRKIHLFHNEKNWFDPGDLPFSVVELAGARVGMMICFDWRFPEAARTLALDGAQVIAHPSNLVLPFAQAAMVTRALENRVFTITANRIGTESRTGINVAFTGQSRMVGPDGSIMSDGPVDEPATGVAEIDPGRADDKTITPCNDLFADRRPEFY
jgi:predicted amidohydrolase